MKNQIKQHSPGYVDCKVDVCEFDTLDELYQIPFVKGFMNNPNFNCFRLNGNVLVSVEEQGAFWWAVGFIKYPERIDIK